MANRRTLKRDIKYICDELIAECIALMLYKPEVPLTDVDNLMEQILTMRNDFVSRVSHTEPGNTRQFYQKLRADFNAQTDDIIEALSNLS